MLPATLRRRLTGGASPSLLARARLVLLALAVASDLAMVPPLVGSRHAAAIVGASVAILLALAAYWIRGYRRATFVVAAEPLEVLAVLVLVHEVPGNPLLPLLGLLFRSLYGSSLLAWARYFAWMAALLAGHAGRGATELNADLLRAVGTGLVPLMANFLRSSIDRLEESERRMKSLVQNTTDVVTIVGPDLSVRWQANSVLRVLGWMPGDLLGKSFQEIVHEDDRDQVRSYVAASGQQPGLTQTLTLRLRHRSGDVRHFEVVIADRRHDASVSGFVLNMRDATERLGLERDLRELAVQREYDALHDPLTGLPNRRSLFAALDEATRQANRVGTQIALLLIDLDRFKELNDTLGHHVGDEILREMRPRLQGIVGDAGLLSRLGGDEFAVLMRPGADVGDARLYAYRLLEAIARPFEYEGLTLILEASVGIATFPDPAADADTLLRYADIAMYEAKRQHSGVEVYDPATNERSRENLALLGELPRAIERGELINHYQPKFDLTTGRLTGVEALVRWEHPTRGLLLPGTFLPLVEHTGLMRPLTLRVLGDAVRQAALWQQQGLRIPVAVNLSAPDLIDASLAEEVSRQLSLHQLRAKLLEVEVTERIIATDPDRINVTLGRLRGLGVTIALDDFGTGSSSLSYLRRLPVQVLKIDRSFIRAASEGAPADVALVATIIGLADALQLKSIAEGIETAEERKLLARLGCDEGQGFALGRPMPAERIAEEFASAALATGTLVA
jgi:diguanylate cyclase (GGDEF)-like protein/PAS domain S-box-containing protein